MTQDDHEPRGAARGPPPAAQVYAKFEETSLEPEEHQDHPDRDTVTIPVHAHHHPNADGDGDGEAQQNDDAPPRPSIMEGFESITPDEFLRVYKVPCAREGFMTGIGVGAVVGTGRYIIGGRIPRAANWGFGAFLVGSIVQWEICRAKRMKERAAMARVVEVMDRKQAEKKAEAARLKQQQEEAEERARQEAAAAKKGWFRFW